MAVSSQSKLHPRLVPCWSLLTRVGTYLQNGKIVEVLADSAYTNQTNSVVNCMTLKVTYAEFPQFSKIASNQLCAVWSNSISVKVNFSEMSQVGGNDAQSIRCELFVGCLSADYTSVEFTDRRFFHLENSEFGELF